MQRLPHAPQLRPSFLKSTHPTPAQKFGAAVEQLHDPDEQLRANVQTLSHEPQWLPLALVSMHPTLGQYVLADAFGQTQLPSRQMSPVTHETPQAPQFALSVAVSVQCPAQSLGAFAGQTHAPLMHD